MYDVDCCLHRGEVGAHERIITTRRTFLQETDTLSPPLFIMLMLAVFTFPSPSLRTSLDISYCCFVFLSLFLFFCCSSDETFFLMLTFASCVLRWLLCNQLSAVEGESFKGMRRRREGEVFSGSPQGSGSQLGGGVWCPAWRPI